MLEIDVSEIRVRAWEYLKAPNEDDPNWSFPDAVETGRVGMFI